MTHATARKVAPKAHADRVLLALGALAAGEVATKREARELAGLGEDALAPYRLQELAARNPEFAGRLQEQRGTLLDFAVDIDGTTVKMRDALLSCAEMSVRSLHVNAKAGILENDPKAVASLKMAKTMIGMCKDCGLWQNDGQDGAPAELEAMRQRQAESMGVDSLTQVTLTQWTRDHRMHSGIGPTAIRKAKEAALLAAETVESEPIPASVGEAPNA